ncbi:hypothetical protein D2962_12650 [Biomaibacter acetigenes]|uniref:DUF4380 domain-containing protein n=1 Tax=Biomaibacter acetigenes TaxID=2316383 RepID=A0A3G2R7F5_9FIRM|nr:hypothetical protein [Biomaibacter acetigenes]AYO31333.1 hypothetical protein D2962_12650 [Biomaibacter acetigenes]
MNEINNDIITYKEFGKCVKLTNDIVDVIITIDFGPRVIFYGFTGKQNEFCECPSVSKTVWDKEWKIRGGHRLWHSPEAFPRSYIPDNDPVEWKNVKDGIKIKQKVEVYSQVQKEIEIILSHDSSKVKIVHSLKNKNAWPIKIAAWALTLLAPGGKEIVPQSQRDTGLLSNRIVALWPYSRMDDPRIIWGNKYIILTHDPNMKQPFKFGIPNEAGWVAYFNHNNVFIKRYNHQMGAEYPDFGVSFETYTTDFMIEIESLSPFKILEPEDTITHVEEWELIKNVNMPSNNEEEIDKCVEKYLCSH